MRAESWLKMRRAPSREAMWLGTGAVAYAWKVPTTGAPRKVLASQLISGAGQATGERVRRVERREHADVVPSRHELLRQRLYVPVDAPLVGPGIRGNEGDAHPSRVTIRAVPYECEPSPGRVWLQAYARHESSAIVPTMKKVADESLATTPRAVAPAAPANP